MAGEIFRIALIGDYNPEVPAHIAIPKALQLCAQKLGVQVQPVWHRTDTLAPETIGEQLAGSAGIWCVPASPYANTDAALAAIRFAREQKVPFLGTCAGFQHAIIEYFRNVFEIQNADHAELNPDAELAIISRLSCSLVDVAGTIRLVPGSRAAQAYGATQIEELYRCNYGFNSKFIKMIENDPDLKITGRDEAGEIRIVELKKHPFFVATLFQPERAAFRNIVPPLVYQFVAAATALNQVELRGEIKQVYKLFFGQHMMMW